MSTVDKRAVIIAGGEINDDLALFRGDLENFTGLALVVAGDDDYGIVRLNVNSIHVGHLR